jgi:hypothetical protein
MKSECESEFWRLTVGFEGKVHCLYLDVLGLVTTAIGNLCDDAYVAMAMPFFRPDGTRATPDDIRAEHRAVKSMFCGQRGAEQPGKPCPWRAIGKVCLAHQGWRAAMGATRLRLTDDGVKQIVTAKMRQHDADLLAQYPRFEAWPWQAQLATHSMAWACGSRFGGQHRGGFPRLAAALLDGDFEKAARECHINESGNPGVAPRNVRNKALYLEAAGLSKDKPAPAAPSVPSPPDPLPFDLSSVRGQQEALARLGHDPGPIDGIRGKRTKAAILSFQRARRLKADGIVGPKTTAELEIALRTSA